MWFNYPWVSDRLDPTFYWPTSWNLLGMKDDIFPKETPGQHSLFLHPFWRTPLTDLTGFFLTLQWNAPCKEIEMHLVDCLEAFGSAKRGKQNCQTLMDDFNECTKKLKQFARINAIREERKRQYKEGILKERYAHPPPLDSYFVNDNSGTPQNKS